jgi:hypothetical protein
LDKNGAEVQSSAIVFTGSEVRVDDVLTISSVDHIVLKADPIPDMGGETWHYQVVC